MSKKLLTGVLALSIMLLGNTAVFSAAPDGKRAAQPLPTSNPSAVFFGQDDARPLAKKKLQRESAIKESIGGLVVTKTFMPTFVCADQDNTDYTLGFWAWSSWRDGWQGFVSHQGNRYSVQENFICSLKTATIWINAIDGSIDFELGVWTGAGGLPTTQVGSVVVNSGLMTAGANNTFSLASLNLAFTDDYFITYRTIPASAADQVGFTDRIQIVMDNNDGLPAATRTGILFSELAAPDDGWFNNGDFWAGEAFAPAGFVEECCEEIPFTDCFLNTHADSYTFLFGLPSTVSCRKGFAMRYSTGGFDTLLVAEFSLSDFFSGLDPNAQVELEILEDIGGVPDPSAPLAPALTVGGVGLGADLFPLGSFGWVDYPINIVPGPSVTYHISVRWTGEDPQTTGLGMHVGADDFQAPALEGNPLNVASVYFPDNVLDIEYPGCPSPVGFEGWNNYMATFGINPDFLLDINVCNDEFIDCELLSNAGNLTFFSTWFFSEGITGFSGAYSAGGDECRIDIASIPIFGYDDLTGMEVGVYIDAAGFPGTAAYSEIVPQGAFPFGNGTSQGVGFIDIFPNAGAGVQVMGAYHVVARPQWGTTIVDPIYQILISDGTDPVAGGYEFGIGSWFPSDAVFTNGNNYYTESFRCCVPFNERVCAPGDDWPTYQHDQQRTGASFNALGEANCNLNVLWTEQSSAGNSFSGSVIFGNRVLISDDNGFDCRDLATGLLIWDQDTDPTVSGLFAGALGNRTQPTVATVTVATLPVQVAILGTGLNRDVVAVDAQTGAYIWHNTTNSPFPGLAPNATEVKSVILGEVLYYSTQNKLYAVNAGDGTAYAPWGTPGATNPFTLGSNNVNALTTDNAGSQIVAPTFNGAVPGNIHSVDAATGLEVWNLATVVGFTGLESEANADTGAVGVNGNEGFFSGASYDSKNDVFWVNSFFDADFPAEGYLYRIAANGSSYSTAQSVRSQRATPVIDENQIYVPAFTKWLNPSISGEQIFSRTTGNFAGNMEGNQAGDRQWSDGVLSCEPGFDDFYIHGTEQGDLNFYQVGNTNALSFYRQVTTSGFTQGQWMGGSLAPDVVVFTNFGGLTVALAPGANRPRLAIVSPAIDVPVPFGTPNGEDVTFANAFTNTGCADLVINAITFTDPTPPSGTEIEFTAVDPALRAKMDEQATFSTNSRLFTKIGLMMGEAAAGTDPFGSYQASSTINSSLNYRAAVLPDVVDGTTGDNGLISPSAGALIAPGDIVDIHIAINGPLVTRGPHPFSANLDTNDPDYFLDDPTAFPSIAMRVIGGCLEDSVRITFGIGGANSTTVYNDGVIARFTGNSANDVDIDGFQEGGSEGAGGTLAELFGGIRGWSLTPRKISMTGPSWDGDDYGNILGDPNYCGNTCVPTLQSGIVLGMISSDNGATYDPVSGDLAAATYIDSAQDYSDGAGGWATDNFPDLFSVDSTIGIIVNETHYGALDVAALANFKLVRVDVTNRSAVNSIDDLVHFAHFDDDIGAGNANNTLQGRPSKGYIYNTSPNEPVAHGYVRVPFGCGVTETITGVAGGAGIAWWNFESNAYYDSLYIYGHGGTDSIHFQPGMNTFAGEAGSDDDAAADFFFGSVDLAPGETKSFGFAHFAFTGSSNPPLAPQVAGNDDQYIDFADMVNKWAGFGRGDVNNDKAIDLADVVYLAGTVGGGNGAFPFSHLGDVNNDGAVDAADVAYLKDYYFNCGPCPVSDWALGLCTP